MPLSVHDEFRKPPMRSRSNKVELHKWLRRSGLSRIQEPSFSHSRLRGLCFCGTFSPSRRQIRWTRSLPTCQPALRSSAVSSGSHSGRSSLPRQ